MDRDVMGRDLDALVRRFVLAVTLALLASSTVLAVTFGFATHADLTVGTTPYGAVVGYFRGQATGKLDIACINLGTSNVSVLLGDGAGGFAAKVDYPTAAGPTGIACGDLRHNGKLDLFVVDSSVNFVSVLLGVGDGTFGTKTDYAFTNGSFCCLADLDGDGFPDAIVTSFSMSKVGVMLNNRSGAFGAATLVTAGAGTCYPATGDLRNVGKVDVVTANNTAGTISVFLGDGAGNLAAKVDYSCPNAFGIALGDVNHDGILDALVGTIGGTTVSVLLGDGAGGFGAVHTYTVGSGGGLGVALGDMNGDGNLDIICTNETAGTVSVLLGDGAGGFGAHSDYTVGASPFNTVALGDFNNDGKPDIVVPNNGATTVSVLLQNTDDTRGSCPSLGGSLLPLEKNTRTISSGSVNGSTVKK